MLTPRESQSLSNVFQVQNALCSAGLCKCSVTGAAVRSADCTRDWHTICVGQHIAYLPDDAAERVRRLCQPANTGVRHISEGATLELLKVVKVWPSLSPPLLPAASGRHDTQLTALIIFSSQGNITYESCLFQPAHLAALGKTWGV